MLGGFRFFPALPKSTLKPRVPKRKTAGYLFSPNEILVLPGRILHPKKKRTDASTLFKCRPKASSAIDLILIDITCLTTITSTSRSRPCSIIPLPGWCLASTSHIAYMKKGQHSQFESVTLKAPKELLYCRKILYTIFP